MRTLLLLSMLVLGQFVLADPPPGYPIVKGEVRKVDMASGRISIKHEEIPNLGMPAMTMSFLAKERTLLSGLAVGDKIDFVADEIDGEITVLWLEKRTMPTLPMVKGVVRKIDRASNRISIKHEAIPNLNMPAMTMSFLAQNPRLLVGLSVGDNIKFTADEIDGELTVLWLEKMTSEGRVTSQVFCTGEAPTNPKTKVEIDVHSGRSSTIRYEYAEGSYIGTAYINSIGDLALQRNGNAFLYQSGEGGLATRLAFTLVGTSQITNARFTHYSSGMKQAAVDCNFVE